MATTRRAGTGRPEHPAYSEDPPAERADHEHVMQEAVDVAAAEETGGLGRPGKPLGRRSPFFSGMAAAAGVAVTFGVAELLIRARSVLGLIGALVAIPAAAAIRLLLHDVTFRRMDSA